jgi:hypothetical protein
MRHPLNRSARLTLEEMEDRVVPAFNLTIDGDVATNNVSSIVVAGTTIFNASGSGATLNVDIIEAALGAGDVQITTGPGGAEAGNIAWANNNTAADALGYGGTVVRTLTIRPDASATGGNVTIDQVPFNFVDNLNLVIDTTAPAADGAINLINSASIVGAINISLKAGTNAINTSGLFASAPTGDITLSAGTILGLAEFKSAQGDVTVNAMINANFSAATDDGTVSVNGGANGGFSLKLSGREVDFAADVGTIAPLSLLLLRRGNVHCGSHAIRADQIVVGDFDVGDGLFTVLDGSGTLTGDVFVAGDGTLAPGGLGTVGTMTIDGNLTFFGGSYAVDLGPTGDQIVVIGTGNVSLDQGGVLGGPGSTGQLSGSGDVKLIDFSGTVSGAFFNAPTVGSKLVLGTDAVHLTHFGPAATGITVARLPATPGGGVTGTELDGTAYTAKLTGGGELVGFPDAQGELALVARGTGALSRVVVATRANASDDVIRLGAVAIGGRLAAFFAPRADLGGGFTATGPVAALTLARVNTPISLGGSATDKSAIKAESITEGGFPQTSIQTPGILSALTTTGSFDAAVTAAAIGAVKVGGTLQSAGFTGIERWNVTGGVSSITAGQIEQFNLSARNLGTLTTIGNMILRLPGDISFSRFTLTGNDGTLGRFGLKTVLAKGNVESATFDVKEGNVGAVTVGRFIGSQLFLDYTQTGAFDTSGSFDSATHFRLASFKTTAATIVGPVNYNFAFLDSQIAADTIGTVRLSGLRTDNFADSFGVKFRTAATSVQVKTTGPGTLPLNVNLIPAASPLAGDFFFLDV